MRLKKTWKKLMAWFLAVAMLLTGVSLPSDASAKSKLKLNKKKATIRVGKTVRLRVRHKKGKQKVKWSSSKQKVAAVNKNGLVRGKKAGKAVIKAKVAHKTLKCHITVKEKNTVEESALPSALAAVSPSASAKASASPSPSASAKASASPSASAGADSSDDPGSSGNPGSSDDPGSSGDPNSSNAPNSSDGPGSSSDPNSSDGPGSSSNPANTDGPGDSSSPDPSAASPSAEPSDHEDPPVQTEPPLVTVAPVDLEISSAPEETESPEPLVSILPGVTEKPGKGESIVVTRDPDWTPVPEVTPEPKYTVKVSTKKDGTAAAAAGYSFYLKKENSAALQGTADDAGIVYTYEDIEQGESYEVLVSGSDGTVSAGTVEVGAQGKLTSDSLAVDGNTVTVDFYTVSFNKNYTKGTSEKPEGIDDQIVLKGQSAKDPGDSKIGRDGYEFVGWTASAMDDLAAGSENPSADDLFQFTKAITEKTQIHAYWKANVSMKAYTVELYEDDDEHLINRYSGSALANSPITAPEMNGYHLKEGAEASYTFNGDANSVFKFYYTKDAEYQVKVTWKPGKVKVGDIAFTEKTETLGFQAAIVLPDGITAPKYYAFAGWECTEAKNTELSLVGHQISEGQTLSDQLESGAELTFTAQWTPLRYQITYDLDGGTGDMIFEYTVEDVQGEGFTLVEPTREACVFDGWIDENSDSSEAVKKVTIKEVSETARKYKATWEAAYIVNHWLETTDLTKEDYELFETETIPGKIGAEVTPVAKTEADAEILKYFVAPDEAELAASKKKVEDTTQGKTTVFNLYYTRHTSTLVWDLGTDKDGNEIKLWEDSDGTLQNKIRIYQVRYGTSFSAYSAGKEFYERAGYTLTGWKGSDGSELKVGESFTMPYTGRDEQGDIDVVYTAQWEANTDTPYTIVYHLPKLGGKGYDNEYEYLTGTTGATATAKEKTFTGFTRHSQSEATQTAKIAGDGSTLFQFYYVRNQYNVTWKLNGGNISGDTSDVVDAVEYGATMTPPEPEKDKYDLTGWMDDAGIAWDAATKMGTAYRVFNAQWVGNGNSKYTIHYMLQNLADNDYTEVTADMVSGKGNPGDKITAPIKDYEGFTAPTKAETLTINDKDTASVTYRYTRNEYTLTFDPYGDGKTSVTTAKKKYGAAIEVPENITKEGYSFYNWTGSDGTMPGKTNPTGFTMPAKDVTYTISWEPEPGSYTVEHYKQNANNDEYTLAEKKTVSKGVKIDQSVTPEVKSYDGFGMPQAQTVKVSVGGTTVKYYYDRLKYNLTYSLAGGTYSGSSVQTVKYGQTVTLPKASEVSLANYTLTGWTYNGTTYNPGSTFTMPNAAAILTAAYKSSASTQVKEYKLTLNLNGGTYSGAVQITAKNGEEVSLPGASDVTLSGYALTGWTDGSNTYNPGSKLTMPSENITLKAVWGQNETGGGSSGGETTGEADIEESADTLILADRGINERCVSKYSFKIGQKISDVENTLMKAMGGKWKKQGHAYSRIDESPQGFKTYVYAALSESDLYEAAEDGNRLYGQYDDSGSGILGEYISYLQLYVQDGVIIGMASISPYFYYQDQSGNTIVSGEQDISKETGWKDLGYNYSHAKYKTTSDAYVIAYVDHFGTKKVYGTRIVRTKDTSGNSLKLDDILDTDTIDKKGGYNNKYSDSEQNAMSYELQEFAMAYRYCSLYTDSARFAKTMSNEKGLPALAQLHSKYNAQDGKTGADAAATSSAELAALKTYLKANAYGESISGLTMHARFKYGYFDYLDGLYENMYSIGRESATVAKKDVSCYVADEMNGTYMPDAMAYLTWWVDGGSDGVSDYADALRMTESSASTKTDKSIDQTTFRISGGFTYKGDKGKVTYATLDLFSLF